MKVLRIIFFIFAMTLIVINTSTAAAAERTFHIHSLLVFGDGDSDNGNTYKHFKFPISPPYWHGRFADGPVYAEFLARDLQLIPDPIYHPNYNKHRLMLDFAYYGAVIYSDYKVVDYSSGFMPPDFRQEIMQYFSGKIHPYAPNTLVVVSLGNDDVASVKCLRTPLLCLHHIVSTLSDDIDLLIAKDYKHFLIVLPGDVSKNPGFSQWITPEWQKTYSLLNDNYLREYMQVKLVVERKHPGVHILLLNALEPDQIIMNRFSNNNKIPCYKNPDSNYIRVLGKVCKNPDKYAYFDSNFYSSAGQKIFADYALNLLKSAKWGR